MERFVAGFSGGEFLARTWSEFSWSDAKVFWAQLSSALAPLAEHEGLD